MTAAGAVEAAAADRSDGVVDPEILSADGAAQPSATPGFAVRVAGFEGPFDLLLALIAKHRIEVTELALHTVTDDFIAYVRAQGPQWDLDEATSFLVVAATLLDLKAARLLPDGQVEDEEDLALLEARDLLFARLLQYRAFKQVAELIEGMIGEAARRRARDVGLEPWQAELLPEVLLGIGPNQFAAIAEAAFAPRPPDPGVSVAHVHAPAVSVREQAAILIERLRRRGSATFGQLVEDAPSTLVVVGRFLALLDLYRDGSVTFGQSQALGQLTVTWSGPEQGSDQDVVAMAASDKLAVADVAGGVPADDAAGDGSDVDVAGGVPADDAAGDGSDVDVAGDGSDADVRVPDEATAAPVTPRADLAAGDAGGEQDDAGDAGAGQDDAGGAGAGQDGASDAGAGQEDAGGAGGEQEDQ